MPPKVDVSLTRTELETVDEVLRGWKLRWDQTNGGAHTPMRLDVASVLTCLAHAHNRIRTNADSSRKEST